jgi:hypothetical protein
MAPFIAPMASHLSSRARGVSVRRVTTDPVDDGAASLSVSGVLLDVDFRQILALRACGRQRGSYRALSEQMTTITPMALTG